MEVEKLVGLKQYSLNKGEKQKVLFPLLKELHFYHLKHSKEYAKIVDRLFPGNIETLADLPFLPVTLFKNFEIKSIEDKAVYKTLISSGTTGSTPSKIFLDTETANLQTSALSNIMQFILGKERLPMLIVDTDALIKDRTLFSARGAGVLGMSIFGKSHFYLMDKNMKVKEDELKQFLEKHQHERMLIFGFTFMVWEYLYEQDFDFRVDLSKAVLVHSGGWKKLIEKSVSNEIFKQKLHEKFGLNNIYNFYGMVEQVGSVFLECEKGYLHTPNFADVIIRNPIDFSVCKTGEEGLMQVLSALPKSYPGISLLTEDTGVVIGEDNCECGRKGKYFKVLGRVKKAELRGCSDTFAFNAEALNK